MIALCVLYFFEAHGVFLAEMHGLLFGDARGALGMGVRMLCAYYKHGVRIC